MKYLLTVLVALAPFFAIAAPTNEQLSKLQETQKAGHFFAQALELYKIDHGVYPSESEGLAVLAKPDVSAEGPYLKWIPLDPWGNPYQYSIRPCPHALSLGEEGKAGGEGVMLISTFSAVAPNN